MKRKSPAARANALAYAIKWNAENPERRKAAARAYYHRHRVFPAHAGMNRICAADRAPDLMACIPGPR